MKFLFFLFLTGAVVWIAAAKGPKAGHTGSSTSADIEKAYIPFDSLRTNLSEYCWPISTALPITSSFADFRLTHFHEGIDISTHGKIGLPVYASRSGYISHISVSQTGYGKMLCIRHADGFTTRYAHLQKFSDVIEEVVKKMQYANGVYPLDVDMKPGEIFVAQHDIIAYSGNTGVGDAHLHFEILDENMNPVNPLLVPSFARLIDDRFPPRFQQIAFIPLDARSRVLGDCRAWVTNIKKANDHTYHIPTVVSLSGRIGICVHANDIIGSSGYANQANEYECYLDGQKIFSSAVLRLPEKNYKQIALHYNWPLYRNGDLYFQKMYIEPGNHLPFYDRQPAETGVIDTRTLANGTHELRIIARDLQGNASVFTAFVAWYSPSIMPANIERPAADNSKDSLEIPLPDEDIPSTDMPQTFHAAEQRPIRKSNSSLSIQEDFSRNFVNITVASYLPFTLRPTLWITTPAKRVLIDLTALDAKSYSGSYEFSPNDRGRFRIEAHADINGTKNIEAFDEFAVYPVTRDYGGIIVSPDSTFVISFPPNAVYETMFCRIEKNTNGYTLQPDDVLLDDGAAIDFRIPETLRSSHVGLFESSTLGCSMLDFCSPESKIMLHGHAGRFLGDFFLASDDDPPSITSLAIYVHGKMLRFSFHIQDDISGIAADQLRITLDAIPVIAEYSAKYALVSYDEPITLNEGTHSLCISASDRMGNTTTVQKTFVVH